MRNESTTTISRPLQQAMPHPGGGDQDEGPRDERSAENPNSGPPLHSLARHGQVVRQRRSRTHIAWLNWFRQRHGTDEQDRLTLRHWGRGWWRYEDGRYRLTHDKDLAAMVTQAVKHEFDTRPVVLVNGRVRPVTRGLVTDVIHALTSLSGPSLSEDVRQTGLVGEPPEDREYIAVANGLLDVRAYLSGVLDVLRPHTPEWFTPVCLPYGFDPAARCPRWIKFIDWMFNGDAETHQARPGVVWLLPRARPHAASLRYCGGRRGERKERPA